MRQDRFPEDALAGRAATSSSGGSAVSSCAHVAQRLDFLLNYCERDTWAMVKVLEKLREVSVG
jgi:hypothetical protein